MLLLSAAGTHSSPVVLLPAATLRAAVPRGVPLVRVRPGVHAIRSEWERLTPWQRYLARVHAVALTHPGAVFALESAAVLIGLPVFGEPREVHLVHAGKSRRFGDVVLHGRSSEPEIVEHGALALTSAVQTTVDLARVLPPAFALAVADAGLRLFATHGARFDIAEYGRAQAERRGVRQLDWIAARATADAESPGAPRTASTSSSAAAGQQASPMATASTTPAARRR